MVSFCNGLISLPLLSDFMTRETFSQYRTKSTPCNRGITQTIDEKNLLALTPGKSYGNNSIPTNNSFTRSSLNFSEFCVAMLTIAFLGFPQIGSDVSILSLPTQQIEARKLECLFEWIDKSGWSFVN